MPPERLTRPKVGRSALTPQRAASGENSPVGWVCSPLLDTEGLSQLASQLLQLPQPWALDWSRLEHLDADAAARDAGRHLRLHQARVRIAVVEEAALGGSRRLSAEAALAIEHRQQGEADAGLGRGGDDAQRHLGDVVVRAPVGLVMQVVELGNPGEARFEHLHVGLRRDRLEIVRRQPFDEAIHLLTPGPERIGLGAAPFREPRHGALKRVAVQIGQARNLAGGEVQLCGHDKACTVSGETC